ncbi:MAG TPA: acylphosphatase [Methermicoccus shengliensis]|uniref:acylphosphatase n=2 Tax=Methermicoccus shengliensis TaxID=660064 RepID=A0A832VX63_9EURY|nr:acylphosphatase [Methermicoccus shengliensis]
MKKRILIEGNLHEVGYRPFLLGLAEALEIERLFADNIHIINGKQAVEVLIDADDDKVEALLNAIKERRPENARVDEVRVEDYRGHVMRTESYYRYLTAMQLAKIATYGGRMLDKQDMTLEKQDRMLEKQDRMLEKQDETLKEIRGVKEEVASISSKLDKTNELLESRFERLEQEIERVKRALIKAGIDIP